MTADASLNAADSRHTTLLDQLEQLWRNKTAVAGLVIVIAFVLTAICAPLLSPHDPLVTSLYDQLKPPVWHVRRHLEKTSSAPTTWAATSSRG